ncbi:hypothetical protein [Tumidithrix helvetica]|uniref:hypothetical protein n=1 Tax=Tumidithrix helvetica TaxID=3457545 RepID=UPI003CC540D5
MKTSSVDILVMSPDGEYLMIVEVKNDDVKSRTQNAIEKLKWQMASTACSVGLLVYGERVILLRDSFEKLNGESINIVGEAKLPDFLLPPADREWKRNPEFEFASRVQRWLETLQRTGSMSDLPDDLKSLFGGSIANFLRLGEVRSAGPRWSKVAR